jgi:RNA polymerase sigma factor for flagellar operon FliA
MEVGMMTASPQPAPVRTLRSVPASALTPAEKRLAPVVNLDAVRQRRLVAEYAPLVDRLVRQAHAKVRFRFAAEELRSAAWVGLLDAHRRFDARRGIPFAAFAQHRIAGSILDEVRGGDTLGRPSRRRSNTIEGIRERLTRRLQREPSDTELARVAGEDLDTYHRRGARQLAQTFLHLEELKIDDSRLTSAVVEKNALDELCDRSDRADLAEAVSALPSRQRTVLSMYYLEEKSYREIGQTLGVTESRVCQIIKSAQRDLRGRLELCG